MENIRRCKWCNLKNPKYITYHDEEWCRPNFDDHYLYETDKTTNELSDELSRDLQKRGMKFVGSTIMYSYLQAVGVIYSHEKECFMHQVF